MDTVQLSAVAHKYTTRLMEAGYTPKRLPEASTVDDRLMHAMWMTMEIQRFIMAGEDEKAHRWLGFVQAVLWIDLGVSIEELKDDNRASG